MNTTPVELPDAIRTWAHAVAARGGAAVLYGSRADQGARPDSDWDIATVGDAALAEQAPVASLDVDVQLVHVTLEDFRARAHVYPGLVYEIASNGVLLACGEGMKGVMSERKETVMDPKKRSDDFGTFIGGAIDYAWEFIKQTDELRFWGKFVAEWSPEDERARTLLPQRSADAAEFAAKALCLAAGSDYAKVHDLNALAEAVPEHLRERVRGLNGHSRNDHMAGYLAGSSSPREVCERVVNAMRLLADMARWQAPLLPERARSLSLRLSDVARSAATLDEARRGEPVVHAFMAVLGAWQARALEVEREPGDAPTRRAP